MLHRFAAFLGLANINTFVSPYLYHIYGDSSGAYERCFHDITLGNNGLSVFGQGPVYPCLVGYDNATGLGSINGIELAAEIKNLIDSSAVTYDIPPYGQPLYLSRLSAPKSLGHSQLQFKILNNKNK